MKHIVEEIILKNGAKGLLVHVPDATVVGVGLGCRALHGDPVTSLV